MADFCTGDPLHLQAKRSHHTLVVDENGKRMSATPSGLVIRNFILQHGPALRDAVPPVWLRVQDPS